MGSRMSIVPQKNAMVINFTQSLVSIDFSCTVSEFQNTGHSQCFSPWEVVRSRFHEKMKQSYTLRKVMRKVSFRSVFLNVLAHEKSYDHDFTKKCVDHKLCVK
ncbi:hypothetical protein GW17_00057954 [Ensete ventricosum]|nr:hypothetical protein GW17_00057954 [Ensete ventricosum]